MLIAASAAGDYRFATDHANDVQPGIVLVLTKTLPRLNIDGIVISPSAEKR